MQQVLSNANQSAGEPLVWDASPITAGGLVMLTRWAWPGALIYFILFYTSKDSQSALWQGQMKDVVDYAWHCQRSKSTLILSFIISSIISYLVPPEAARYSYDIYRTSGGKKTHMPLYKTVCGEEQHMLLLSRHRVAAQSSLMRRTKDKYIYAPPNLLHRHNFAYGYRTAVFHTATKSVVDCQITVGAPLPRHIITKGKKKPRMMEGTAE